MFRDRASAIASVAHKAMSTFPMSSMAPYAHHSHAPSRMGRPIADTPDGVTLTHRRAPLALCKSWPRRVAALIEHVCEASWQDVARCCRDKLDVACCVVRKPDLSLNSSGSRSPTDRDISLLLEQVQRGNRARELPLLCPNGKPFDYIVLKPSPLLKALMPHFPRENIVATWETNCESCQEDAAKQRPECASC